MTKSLIEKSFLEHEQVLRELLPLVPHITQISEVIVKHILAGATVFFMGNGGSAADSLHMAAELLGRFTRERRAIPAMALTANTSTLTSLSNDYEYSVVFSRQLEALCKPGDVVIGISTSGSSLNVIKGIEVANQKEAYTIALTGKEKNKLAAIAQAAIQVPSTITARVQEMHLLIEHVLCDSIEDAICQADKNHADRN